MAYMVKGFRLVLSGGRRCLMAGLTRNRSSTGGGDVSSGSWVFEKGYYTVRGLISGRRWPWCPWWNSGKVVEPG